MNDMQAWVLRPCCRTQMRCADCSVRMSKAWLFCWVLGLIYLVLPSVSYERRWLRLMRVACMSGLPSWRMNWRRWKSNQESYFTLASSKMPSQLLKVSTHFILFKWNEIATVIWIIWNDNEKNNYGSKNIFFQASVKLIHRFKC